MKFRRTALCLLTVCIMCIFLQTARQSETDPLAVLRKTLDRFAAESSVQGELTLESIRTANDDDGGESLKSIASVLVKAGSDGVSVHASADLIAAVRQSDGRNDELKPSPGVALGSITVPQVDELLNAGGALLQGLEHVTFERQQPVADGGEGVRELVFRIDPPIPERDRKRIRELDMTLSVRVDADGNPLEARYRTRMRGRVMLVSFEMSSDEVLRFQVIGDRLVAVYSEKKESGSGMGQSSETHRVFRFVPAGQGTSIGPL